MKKKFKYFLLITLLLFVGVFTIIYYYNENKQQGFKENEKEINKNSIKIPGMVSLMLETKAGSGEYKISSERVLPTSGYEFNSERSGCENGGTLSWNNDTQKLVLKTRISDKCYAYFDVLPPDVSVSITNRPTTYGKLGSINCTDGSATYNQQYNRVEISSIDNKYTSCNLNYTDSTSKVNLATYISGLVGTTQGNGQVVSEIGSIDNSTFTPGSVLAQSNYSNLSNDATYPFTWDSTNKTWTSTNHTDSTTSTISFNVSSSGYYQLCYKQSSEKNYDYAIFYKNNAVIKSLSGGSNTNYECFNLGNLTTSDTIKATYQKDNSTSNGNDNVIFYLQSGTYNQKIDKVNAGIRYEGKNPNNYIWFNNEYWRIIGVFDSDSHGQSGKSLVKIIREEPIGGLAWDKSNTNDWVAAILNKLLNGAYYNAQDGTDSGYCVTTNCDYTKKGIQSGYRSMIANVTWYLGGSSSSKVTADAFYNYERGTTVYSGRPTSTTGYIGLMYPSDYGYSVLASSCARTTTLSTYGSSSCGGQSWLYGKGFEWTIASDSLYMLYVFSLNSSGNVDNNYANRGIISYNLTDKVSATRPVLYLEASVYKLNGDGSLNSPYIVGM